MGLLLAGILPAADKTEGIDGIAKKIIKVMDDLADKLGEIKDNDSADKVIPDIAKLVKQMQDFGKKSKTLKLSDEEKKAFQKKYGEKIQTSAKKVQTAAQKAMKNAPDRAKKIQAALQGQK
jgi:hypothetical protein